MATTVAEGSADAPPAVHGPHTAGDGAGSTVEHADLRGLRERVHTAVHGDVGAVSKLLMAWSGKIGDLVIENGQAMIRCPVPGHEDPNRSCRVYESKKERVYFQCRGCGSIGDLVTAHQLIFHSDVELAMLAAAGAFGILFETHDIPRHGDSRVTAVIDAASKICRVSADSITGDSRRRPIVDARQAAMYVARHTTDLSYPDLGRAFGGRDHTTVIHAVSKIERLMGEKAEVRQRVLSIRALVDNGAT